MIVWNFDQAVVGLWFEVQRIGSRRWQCFFSELSDLFNVLRGCDLSSILPIESLWRGRGHQREAILEREPILNPADSSKRTEAPVPAALGIIGFLRNGL